MQFGISQLVAPNLPQEEFFQRAAAAGYEVVELCTAQKGPLSLQTYKKETARILDLSKQYHLPVVSLVQGHCSGNLLAGDNSQKTGIEETRQGLQVAADLGIKCTLHTLGRLSPELYYDEAYRNGVAALKTIAETAEKLKVAIAVEFVWNGFLFSPLEMKHFLEEVGSKYIGFYFDPGNMAIFQYPHHWARILGRHIKMVHLKDWNGNSLNGAWPALLKGNIDFKAVMKELHASGYDGPLISEVPPDIAPLEETAKAIRKIIEM